MSKTPDPNYWGNPPQTPQSQYASNQPSSAPQQGFNAQAPNPTPNYPNSFNEPPKKNNRGVILAIVISLILFLILGIAGFSACATLVSDISNSGATYFELADPSETPNTSADSETAALNQDFRDAFGLSSSDKSSTNDTEAITADELAYIQQNQFKDASKSPNEQGQYAENVYTVGTDIDAGTYWLTGSDTNLSYFYILQPTENKSTSYNVVHSNNYFGHNLMNFEDGDVVVFVNQGTMFPIEKLTEKFTTPYKSGVYRVGTDIPAGNYRVNIGEADSYSAYYIMSDLNYNSDSYEDSDYFTMQNPGTKAAEITLEDGQYIELYNMTMSPEGNA